MGINTFKWVALCCALFDLQQQASYLKGDVIELAAVADGRSARMNHPVHLHNARAAPRSFAGPFPGGAACRRTAGRCFAFGSLLARHVSRIQNYLYESQLKQANSRKKSPDSTVKLQERRTSTRRKRFPPARWTHFPRHLPSESMSMKLPPARVVPPLPALERLVLFQCAARRRGGDWDVAENSTSSAKQCARGAQLERAFPLTPHAPSRLKVVLRVALLWGNEL